MSFCAFVIISESVKLPNKRIFPFLSKIRSLGVSFSEPPLLMAHITSPFKLYFASKTSNWPFEIRIEELFKIQVSLNAAVMY